MKALRLITLLFLISGAGCHSRKNPKTVVVAAASDLRFALDSIVHEFREKFPHAEISVTYGSSGKLTEQIRNGGPFSLFLSADSSYPSDLFREGYSDNSPETYAFGRLAFWSRNNLVDAIGYSVFLHPSIHKISIANPAHAPYGKKAEEFFRNLNYWDTIQPKLVLGENIAQAAQFAEIGGAEIALISHSLASRENMMKNGGRFHEIPDSLCAPLIQQAIKIRGRGSPESDRFWEFIFCGEGRDILSLFGFGLPEKQCANP